MDKSKRFFVCMIFAFSIFSLLNAKSYSSWSAIADDMSVHLQEAVTLYEKGDGDAAKQAINTAYFKYYEKLGFEKTVMSYISGKRGAAVESTFHDAKHLINSKETPAKLKILLATLSDMLHEDALVLDGGKTTESKQADKLISFLASFGLTVREGLEAILVIAAIIAYLVKTQNTRQIRQVYAGALLGIVFSIVLALIFNTVAAKIGEAQSGLGQEIFEGFAMFLAVIVLFWVSNWMISKAEVEVWNQYIQKKVEQSVTRGSAFALVFTAFLAVAREGAELILFFQGLQANASNSPTFLWLGLAVAIVVLVVVYIAIRYFSVRLPLKPFFYATSILMFILCFSFLGKGVFELQEADMIGRTLVPWMGDFSFDFLGIYNRYENIIPQMILLVITIGTIIWHLQNSKKIRIKLENEINKN